MDLLRSLGVDEPIDYTTTKFEDVATNLDAVIDLVGGDYEDRSCSLLKNGGALVSVISPTSMETAAKYGATGFFHATQGSAPHLAEIAGLMDSGKIKVIVDNIFPLQETARAQDLNAAGHVRGKLALRVAG